MTQIDPVQAAHETDRMLDKTTELNIDFVALTKEYYMNQYEVGKTFIGDEEAEKEIGYNAGEYAQELTSEFYDDLTEDQQNMVRVCMLNIGESGFSDGLDGNEALSFR